MKKTILSFILLVTFISISHAEKRRVLFLGNSYTYVNDLPNTLKYLALYLGDTIETDSYTPGGSTLQTLSADANTLAKIQLGNWDYVVVQAQSQEPSFPPAQVATDTYPYAHIIDSMIHAINPCAETIFYMTWGRKNGDAGNCAGYPVICTYEGMQMRLRESYLEMTQTNNATCSPVGVAWRTYRNAFPSVDLYQADESHPSVNGTYLAACVFYSTIYQKSTVGATYLLGGVGNGDAADMQLVASTTVLDSLENWQLYGSLPFAKFNYTALQNQITFTNASVRSTLYTWDFGDGSPLENTANAVHTYNTVGTYTVTLTTKNACNKYSVATKTIVITSVANGVNDIDSYDNKSIYYANNLLISKDNFSEIKIMNVSGQVVLHKKLMSNNKEIDCGFLPQGIYFYQAILENNKVIKGKFLAK